MYISAARNGSLLSLLFLDETLPALLHCRPGLVIRAAIHRALFAILAVSRCLRRSSTLIRGGGGLIVLNSRSIRCIVTLGHVNRIGKVNALVDQVGVFAVVLDPAALHNNYLVTPGQEMNMMRDEQPRCAGGDFSGDGSSEEMLTDMRIYRRERVVQKEQLGLLRIHGPGQRDAGLLPAAQVDPLLADFRSVSRRQHGKIIEKGAGFNDLLVPLSVVPATEQNVAPKSIVDDPGRLSAERGEVGVLLFLGRLLPGNVHLGTIHGLHLSQHSGQEGRLAAPDRTDDADQRSGLDGAADVAEGDVAVGSPLGRIERRVVGTIQTVQLGPDAGALAHLLELLGRGRLAQLLGARGRLAAGAARRALGLPRLLPLLGLLGGVVDGTDLFTGCRPGERCVPDGDAAHLLLR